MSILQFVGIEAGDLLNLICLVGCGQLRMDSLEARDLGEILSLNYKNDKYLPTAGCLHAYPMPVGDQD